MSAAAVVSEGGKAGFCFLGLDASAGPSCAGAGVAGDVDVDFVPDFAGVRPGSVGGRVRFSGVGGGAGSVSKRSLVGSLAMGRLRRSADARASCWSIGIWALPPCRSIGWEAGLASPLRCDCGLLVALIAVRMVGEEGLVGCRWVR